jgi:hypothetical protein
MAAREPNCVPCLWPEQAVRYRFTVNGYPIRQCVSCGLGLAEPGRLRADRLLAGYFNGQPQRRLRRLYLRNNCQFFQFSKAAPKQGYI